jgi:hypothetical protein
MPFMVVYRAVDGSPCYEQADAIDEAALLVERLRNKEGLDQIRIYRMEEISFAFRPYYKVELGLTDRQSMPASPSDSSGVAVEGSDPGPATSIRTNLGTPLGRPEDRVDHRPDVAPEVARRTPPPVDTADETAGANGHRGLFGR